MNDHLLSLFGRFGIGHLLRRLSLEKHDGVSSSTLIIAPCLFRINESSIFSCYRQHFHGLLEVGKNCFYRMMQRGSADIIRGKKSCKYAENLIYALEHEKEVLILHHEKAIAPINV